MDPNRPKTGPAKNRSSGHLDPFQPSSRMVPCKHLDRFQSTPCKQKPIRRLWGVKGKMEHKEKVLHLSFALQFPSAWNRLEMVVKLNELSVFIKLLTDVFNSQWATAHGVCCFFILLVSSSKSKLKIEITILFNGGFHVQLNLSEWPQSHLIR